MHSEGPGRKVWALQIQGQGWAWPVRSTWLRTSGESFRLLMEAAFWITCLASSTLPLVRSHRADSGRALQVRNGSDLGAHPPPPHSPRGLPSCSRAHRTSHPSHCGAFPEMNVSAVLQPHPRTASRGGWGGGNGLLLGSTPHQM